MSGTRRLIASRVELLADEPLVGPTEDEIILSAPVTTRLGNNPSLFTFVIGGTNLAPASGNTQLPVTLLNGVTRYFNALDTNSPYHTRLTPSVNTFQARLSALFGLGMKAVLTFQGFASYGAAIASPIELTIAIHGTDNLGNTWDKTNTLLFSPAAGAAGKSFSMSIPIVDPHLASRTHYDFYFTSDNPAGVTLNLNGMTAVFDIQQ